MVELNQTVGATKGITVIALGQGDTKVSYCQNKEEGYTGIVFINDTVKPIGETGEVWCGTTTDSNPPNAMLIFTSVESIEVLEKQLKNAKMKLKLFNSLQK